MTTKQSQIGLIGCGEMGAAIGGAFTAGGLTVRTVVGGRSEETLRRAADANLAQVSNLTDLVATSDIIFSVLPPAEAKPVAEQIASAVSDHALTIVEANAVSPATVRSIAALFGKTQIRFVDGGLVGGPPRGTMCPRLYTSGHDCKFLDELDGIAFDRIHLGIEIGQASGFKMAYAALTKGLNTLLTAGLLAAEEMGILNTYLAELEGSQGALLKRAEANIPRLPADAGRWVREMEEIRDTFEDLGLPGGFHQAAADIMRLLAGSRFGGETRQTRDHGRSMQQTVKDLLADRHSSQP